MVCGLPIAAASLVSEHRFWGSGLRVAHGLSCSEACGILQDEGSNSCCVYWQQILNHWTTREVLGLLLTNVSGAPQDSEGSKVELKCTLLV